MPGGGRCVSVNFPKLRARILMSKPKVFATHSLFGTARKILNESCDVEYWAKPERPPREEVLRRGKEKDGLGLLVSEKGKEGMVEGAAKRRIAADVAGGGAQHEGAGWK